MCADKTIQFEEPELQHEYERLQSLAGPDDVLRDLGWDSSAAAVPVDADASSPVEDLVNLFDPGFFGVGEADWLVAGVADEGNPDGAQELGPQLGDAEKHYLPFSRKKEGRQALKKVTIEDFDTREERIAFLAIEKHKIDLFGHKSKPASKLDAVKWFFCREDHGGVTFDICAELLDSRADVIRLRIHYEFWLRWSLFSEEFPFMTIPVPNIIQGEILFHTGDEGIEIAQEAWLMPGIETDDLLMKAAGENSINAVAPGYHRALELLESRYLLSSQHGHWYLTGRNPLQHRLDIEKSTGRIIGAGNSFHWSRLFARPRVK